MDDKPVIRIHCWAEAGRAEASLELEGVTEPALLRAAIAQFGEAVSQLGLGVPTIHLSSELTAEQVAEFARFWDESTANSGAEPNRCRRAPTWAGADVARHMRPPADAPR